MEYRAIAIARRAGGVAIVADAIAERVGENVVDGEAAAGRTEKGAIDLLVVRIAADRAARVDALDVGFQRPRGMEFPDAVGLSGRGGEAHTGAKHGGRGTAQQQMPPKARRF